MGARLTSRRVFVRDLGLGVVALTVGGTLWAACGGDEASPSGSTSVPGATPPPGSDVSPPAAPVRAEPTVRQVLLDFVSAYVVVRGTEAVVVDTGVGGSAPAIERGLAEVGVGWSDVGHVLLTHRHPDHVGSLGDVAARASDAVLYAGAADVEAIDTPRPLEPVGDGDTVLGMKVVDTPGHTPGHVSVFDPEGAVLIAGDSLNGEGSGVETIVDGVGGPNPRFTADMATAIASVRKLAALAPDTIYFGHGEPKLAGAAVALDALVARL